MKVLEPARHVGRDAKVRFGSVLEHFSEDQDQDRLVLA